MKRFLAVAVVALAAVAVYAAVAPAGPTVVTPKQFSALSKKVAAQGKTINSLKKELASVETCAFQQAVGVAQYGDATTEGYVYQNADKSLEIQTALDVAPQASAPGYMLLTNKQCADIINGGKKKTALFRAHR
jgi:hypothetical protein